MKSRISVGWALMLAAIVFSVLPAATVGATPVAAQSACDWAQFIADVTVPDGTTFAPNTSFTKTWRLKNIGSCTWTTSYALVFDSGDRMGGPTSVNLPTTVAPGQTVDISIGLTAPAAAGHYIGYWKFKNASGVLFGIGSTFNKPWWVEINVSGTAGGVAYDFAANYCSASWYSISGALPCPGSDGDSRGFVLKVDNPRLENGAYDTGSGLITNPQSAYNGDIHGVFPAFRVQSGDKFRATVNCAYGATSCYVTFRLEYQIGSGPIYTLWAFREKYEGLYYRASVDLSMLAGQDVKFILTVLATGSGVGDRALWSNPAIVRLGSPPPPPPTGSKFDFGTSSSPLASGYARVTEATAYTAGSYGWTSTSGLESRDRAAPADDLKRDFVTSSSGTHTFRADLPNGSYSVTVTMGDNGYAHDNMVVKANGSTMLSDVDTAVGAFAINTFNVTVSGGYLALEFSDAGGADTSWVVNAVSFTPVSPPAGCDRAQFVADVTVPDGTVFAPGAAFTKTWRLKNVGTCTWTTSYLMVFDSGDKMGGPDSINMPSTVAPGQTVDVSVNLTAPSVAGSYRGYWKFQNASGVRFGIGSDATKSWWVDIRVSGSTLPGTKFDFGTATSPVATGYTRVTESTGYAGSFGWTSTTGLESRDRGAPADDLKRDFVMSSSTAGTFKTNLPNGSYAVTITMGDNDNAHDNMVVKANGSILLSDVDSAAGAFAINTFNVTVTGGTLSLEFSDAGGSDGSWIVNAVSIAPTTITTTNKFDFGTSPSPVGAGYARVTDSTAYISGSYGWASTTGLESRDRGAPADDLKRDFVMSSSNAQTFRTDVPNGTYSVTVTMGDNDFAHDDMVVKANATTMLSNVDTAKGAFAINTFNVTVTGGYLALEFSDAGGADGSWIVNALTITPSSQQTGCDKAQFIADVTVPDGTVFAPGVTFTKTWRLKNVGTCTWTTSYLLVFDSGDKMGGPDSVNMPSTVTPGQTVDVSVNLTAPSVAGSYRGYWKFQNASGFRFGIGADASKSWWVDIRVSGIPPTPGTPTPTSTPVAGTTYDFAANACSAVWSSDAGQLPCPGTEGDQRGFVLKLASPQLENGSVDSRLGLLTYPQNTYNGYILGIYPPYHVKTGDRFRSIVNCAYGATSCYVIFRLDYQTGTGPITTFWAFIEKYEGQYYQADIDLGPLVGQDVKFILHVLSAGSPTGDRALWVAPLIYNPSSPDTSVPTATPTPTTVASTATPTPTVIGSTATPTPTTATPTPTTAASTSTPTPTGTPLSGWSTYANAKYGFAFQIPPGSSIASQSDNGGRVYLPFAPDTNLVQKYLDVSVAENVPVCKTSEQAPPGSPTENLTINGIPFFKESGGDAAAGNLYEWTAYSTTKGVACVSLLFVFHSVNAGNFQTPPPLFDPVAEGAVFSTIMSTYTNQ